MEDIVTGRQMLQNKLAIKAEHDAKIRIRTSAI